jgi:pyruvate ferredoxin oxidoreductase alpha subunit
MKRKHMQKKLFISGNEAVAWGVKLARPHVIAAYPITPQTIVVERLAEMTASGELAAEYLHVESEHSALSAMMGASATGARTFTATSSQGLLYMTECLHYASGGRFPIVMMNANRALAPPWSIYGDQRDSLSLLDCGWIQAYAEDAQESLDLIVQAYKIAENPSVLTPVMVNLDGYVLTHTYEPVILPDQGDVDDFLPPYVNPYAMDLDNPKNIAFSSTPADTMEFKFQQHRAMIDAKHVISSVDSSFGELFGRHYGGLVVNYWVEDADCILITLGSITGTVKSVVDELRKEGIRAGVCRIRFMRPFPDLEIAGLARSQRAIGVLEKDISFGYEGTVATNVKSALCKTGKGMPVLNFIAGLGGRTVSRNDIKKIFYDLDRSRSNESVDLVQFVNLGVTT